MDVRDSEGARKESGRDLGRILRGIQRRISEGFCECFIECFEKDCVRGFIDSVGN